MTTVRSLSGAPRRYSVRFLRDGSNQPIRGAAIGIARRLDGGWSRDAWVTTDNRGNATFMIPGDGRYRLTTHVRGVRREVQVDVTYTYQTNRLWVLADGTVRLDRFVP